MLLACRGRHRRAAKPEWLSRSSCGPVDRVAAIQSGPRRELVVAA